MSPAGGRLLRDVPIRFSEPLLIDEAITIQIIDIHITSLTLEASNVIGKNTAIDHDVRHMNLVWGQFFGC